MDQIRGGNLEALRTLSEATGGGREIVIGSGDVTIDADELEASGILDALGLEIVRPSNPSYACTLGRGSLIDYLEYTGVDRIALTGMSLGGYTSALIASVDDRIQAVIPNVPVVTPDRTVDEWFPANKMVALRDHIVGTDRELSAAATMFPSPLNYRPLPAKDRRLIIAGLGDRLAPPEQAEILWNRTGKNGSINPVSCCTLLLNCLIEAFSKSVPDGPSINNFSLTRAGTPTLAGLLFPNSAECSRATSATQAIRFKTERGSSEDSRLAEMPAYLFSLSTTCFFKSRLLWPIPPSLSDNLRRTSARGE